MSKQRILVVEDEPYTAELTRAALARAGFRVAIAADAAALAVALSQKDRPDLVLLALDLPFMDGLQIVRALKADRDFCHIPIVAFSKPDDPRAAQAMLCGCAGFVAKPLEARAFHSSVAWFFDAAQFPPRTDVADAMRFARLQPSAGAARAN